MTETSGDATRAKKIAFLLRDLGEGGAERSSLRLANGLSQQEGLSVRLLLLKLNGPMLTSVSPNVEVVNLKGSFFRLLRELHSNPVDFLLPVYTSMRALLAKMLLSFRANNMKVVLSQRGMFTMDRGPIQTRLRFARCRLLYPYAACCVCISEGVANEMRALNLLPSEKIHVVYNPVVTEELNAQMEAPLTHPWFAEGERTPVILSVGRLSDQKDCGTLIEAFAIIARQRDDLRLLILGEGKQRAKFEALVRANNLVGRVAMPGYTSNPYPYMRRAALFVMTSLHEGFGNVVAEALACGCNVVSTDCPGGPAEILKHGKYGRLAQVGDAEDVARAIRETLAAPLSPDILRERAAFFSEARAVEGYLRVMDCI
ncbi:glycosyl transferase [Synergistales bacterium]|nr:glycosyl transferase [Synergistales bacterium]